MVKDIADGADGSNPRSPVAIGGGVMFFANDGAGGEPLWRSDGTPSGTVKVSSIFAQLPMKAGGLLFMYGSDGPATGAELWRSDGTPAGTMLVKDIWPGFDGSGPTGLADVGGTLFFAASDETSYSELWKSDGTTAGTELVRDINAGPEPSSPTGGIDVGGTLFFTATDGVTGYEL